MKRGLLFSFILLLMSSVAFGGSANEDLFSYDKAELEQEFSELNQLEAFLIDNEDAELADVQLNFSSILNTSSPSAMNLDIDRIDWGAFAWGFFCCPIGLFTVALNDRARPNEITSFWYGVIASAVLNAVSTGIYYIAIAARMSTTTTY